MGDRHCVPDDGFWRLRTGQECGFDVSGLRLDLRDDSDVLVISGVSQPTFDIEHQSLAITKVI
jgi:hypothetical protein